LDGSEISERLSFIGRKGTSLSRIPVASEIELNPFSAIEDKSVPFRPGLAISEKKKSESKKHGSKDFFPWQGSRQIT